MRKFKHLCFLMLDLVWLVVRDHYGVIRVFPRDSFLLNHELKPFQVWNVDALVVLLVCGLEHYLLLLVIDLNHVSFFWVGQVPYAPLKAIFGVFALELRVAIAHCHQVCVRVECFWLLADFVLPFRRLLGGQIFVSWSFPFANEHFIRVEVQFLGQPGLVWIQVVQLSATVLYDHVASWLSLSRHLKHTNFSANLARPTI